MIAVLHFLQMLEMIKKILKFTLFATPAVLLVVPDNMFFPFISALFMEEPSALIAKSPFGLGRPTNLLDTRRNP